MNTQHRQIRELLRAMAPKRAASYIQAFGLPAGEEACLLLCEVKRMSYPQVCDALHMTPETVKRNRQRAFAHMADQLNHI